MKLKYCSITGADDAVDSQDLASLSEEFPFAEWAVLLMPSVAGTPRFPSTGWIDYFASRHADLNKAMHLCGDAFLGFVGGDKDISDLMSGFGRIQLNLKFGDVEGRYDTEALLARIRERPEQQFIIQYTADKEDLLPRLAAIPNHAVLFDASAGRGISPDHWPQPLPGHACGYAGGINPDNINLNLSMIATASAGHETWIDMETGVRTEDRFDLGKVRSVLQAAAAYAA